MTPADYLRTIVLPTLVELMGAPGDQRRAYLACITAAHLVDHVDVAHGSPQDGKRDVRAAVRALNPYTAACLAIVEGVSNATKHAELDPKRAHRFDFAPGRERFVPAFALDVEGAGWDEGVWDAPGLIVGYPMPDGLLGEAGHMLDDSVRAVVRGYAATFPALFADVDLAEVAPERDRYAFMGCRLVCPRTPHDTGRLRPRGRDPDA